MRSSSERSPEPRLSAQETGRDGTRAAELLGISRYGLSLKRLHKAAQQA